MGSVITNIYEELRISTSVTKVQDILAAIDAQIKTWQRRVNIPKYKLEAVAHTAALRKIRGEIQANPAILKQHASAYEEIEKRRRLEKEKEVRAAGNIFVQDGEIAQEYLTILVNKTKLSEREILSILGVRVGTGQKKPKFEYQDDGVPELDRIEMGRIETNLKALAGPKTLYDFLGVQQNASAAEISGRIDAVAKNVSEDPHKTDPVVCAKKALADLSRSILKDPTKRKSYDKALENAPFAPVADLIRNLKAGASFITADVYKKLIEAATQLGIPLGKAKFLIHKTAASIQLPIASDEVADDMVQCRFCAALNTKGSSKCRSCGMPIIVVCPECGTKSKPEELSCTQCGFHFADMMHAPEFIRAAETALDDQDSDSALNWIRHLELVWKTHPRLSKLKDKCTEVQRKNDSALDAVLEMCQKKCYYEARTAIASLGASTAVLQEKERITAAIGQAEKQLAEIRRLQDPSARFDGYMQVLSACADCQEAKSALESNPPVAPSDIRTDVRGSTVTIQWKRLNSRFIEYRIIRKEGGRPTSVKDGEFLADTANAPFDDTHPIPGVSYFYAVYSKCGEVFSKTGLVSERPALVVSEVDLGALSFDIQERSVCFSVPLPRNAKAIEIFRDNTWVKTIYGSSFTDTGLLPGREYQYRFVAVFKDSASVEHKSNGVTVRIKPMAPPKPVSLSLTDGEKEARLAWMPPAKGMLSIFVSDNPLPYHANDIVNLNALKLQKLNVSGTYCVIPKNFSGERYFLPLTILGNTAVAGEPVRLVSVVKPTGVRFDRNDGYVMVRWSWNDTSAVRIKVVAGNTDPQSFDFDSKKSTPERRIDFPRGAKSLRISVHSLVKSGTGNILLSDGVECLISLAMARVSFHSVSKAYFKSVYTLKVSSDSILPGTLSLLISEGFSPIDLVNYKSYLTISPADLRPGEVFSVEIPYTRKTKGPVFFRLIATDRSLAKQISIVPETRKIK